MNLRFAIAGGSGGGGWGCPSGGHALFQTAVPAEKAALPAGFDFLIQFFELSETDQVGDGIVLEE